MDKTPIESLSVVITENTENNYIHNFQQNFIWDGKTSKIAQQTLIQPIQNGGLKFCHFETKVRALKLSWVKRLACKTPSNWKILQKSIL